MIRKEVQILKSREIIVHNENGHFEILLHGCIPFIQIDADFERFAKGMEEFLLFFRSLKNKMWRNVQFLKLIRHFCKRLKK